MNARAQLAVCMRATRWAGNTTLYEIQNSCMGPAARACSIVSFARSLTYSTAVSIARYRYQYGILWAAEFVLWA